MDAESHEIRIFLHHGSITHDSWWHLMMCEWPYRLFMMQSVCDLATQGNVLDCYVAMVMSEESLFFWSEGIIEHCK